MNDRPLRVLLVEDNPGDVRLIREMLEEAAGESFVLEHVSRLRDAVTRLGRESRRAGAEGSPEEAAEVDVILLDLSLPDAVGLQTVRWALEEAGDIPLVVLTGLPDADQARLAVQEGAQDYLVKGQVTGELLSRSLRYAIERGRVESELRRRAEELAEADRRKDRFLAMLSHELRAPLAPILSAAEVMRAAGPLDDARLEWARDTIARQVRHMAGLLEDLLDLSRITMGKIRIRKRPTRLQEVVEPAVATTRPLMEKRGQELSVSLPSEPVWLSADPDRIEQVLVNLLSNASTYTDEGGSIRLSAEIEPGRVAIRVLDTGIGMDAETLERIFEPFTQGESAARRSEGGLGIGLSLAATLVDLHGGEISARSPGQGQGSEFEIRLPRLEEPPDARTPGAAEGAIGDAAAEGGPTETAGARVLIVDDNADAAEGLRLLLASWGCDVRVAHGGRQALEVARAWTPAMVLLDIGLPDLDGYAVARALRRDERGEGIRIVAVSGYGQRRDRERARTAGFDGYLVKPVHPPEVRRLFRRAAAGSDARSPELVGAGPPSDLGSEGTASDRTREAGAGPSGGSGRPGHP